jgi:RNA ligase (TIGR02306 family)
VFGVCSRNLELADPGEFVPGMVMCEDGVERPKKENTFWKIAKQFDLEGKMKSTGMNIAIQGELIGEGIQGNPYKIKGHTIRVFNVFMIDEYRYLEPETMSDFVKVVLDLETVPIIDFDFVLPETIDELLKMAESKSVLCATAEREGIVIRSYDRSISFKAISNKFLLNGGE